MSRMRTVRRVVWRAGESWIARSWVSSREQLHRADGPAIEYPDGTKHWYQRSKLHRVGGPAVDASGGYRAWYERGRFIRAEIPT